jgi:hypothetical protein
VENDETGRAEMRNVYNILMGKLEVKRQLGKRRHRLKNNVVDDYSARSVSGSSK